MLGIDARAARATWTVILVGLTVVVIYQIRVTLLLFTIALLLAYLLWPLVNLIDRASLRRFPRTLSLAVVYLLLLAFVSTVGGVVGSQIVDEASQLASKVPEWLDSGTLTSLPVPAWLEPWKVKASDSLREQIGANVKEIVPLLQKIGQRVISMIGNLGFVVLVPILSFFFLKDAPAIRHMIVSQFIEGPRRSLLEDLLSDIHILLGQFMRALVILAAATFLFYGLFFWIVGVPYAALLASLAGVLEFIPVIGPLSASIVILLVSVLAGKLTLALWVLIFLLVYRLFQDYVLQPHLMSAGVALHPLWVIFAVLAGEQVAGVAGMFLSIPVLATLRVVVVRVRKSRDQTKSIPTGP